MSLCKLSAAVVALAVIATPSFARERWQGKDPERHTHVIYSAGGGWVYKDSGLPGNGTLTFTEVTRTADYIELQIDGIAAESGRIRISNTRLYCRSKRQATGWLEIAKGYWKE